MKKWFFPGREREARVWDAGRLEACLKEHGLGCDGGSEGDVDKLINYYNEDPGD